MHMNESPIRAWSRKHPRLAGLAMVVICGGVGYWQVQSLIAEAKAGDLTIHFSGVEFGVLCAFGFFGLVCAIGGHAVTQPLERMGQQPRGLRFYAVAALILMPGVLGYLWLKHQLAAYGYG